MEEATQEDVDFIDDEEASQACGGYDGPDSQDPSDMDYDPQDENNYSDDSANDSIIQDTEDESILQEEVTNLSKTISFLRG